MTEYNNPIDIREEIRRLRLKAEQLLPGEEKEKLTAEVLKLTLKRGEMSRRLSSIHDRMKTAADKAEKEGVRDGGKGSPEESSE